MAFGKPGRPPADRLERQLEIYQAVSPLILEQGPRNLTMPEAAHAACLSIGGLYHYFPSKRQLVLHGLDPDARQRHCSEYRHLLATDSSLGLAHGIGAYLNFSVAMLTFVRPSVYAALELGIQGLQDLLHPGWTHNVADLANTIDVFAPGVSLRDREALALAMRSLAYGFLFDVKADPHEWRDHARLLIDGCLLRSRYGDVTHKGLTVQPSETIDAASTAVSARNSDVRDIDAPVWVNRQAII